MVTSIVVWTLTIGAEVAGTIEGTADMAAESTLAALGYDTTDTHSLTKKKKKKWKDSGDSGKWDTGKKWKDTGKHNDTGKWNDSGKWWKDSGKYRWDSGKKWDNDTASGGDDTGDDADDDGDDELKVSCSTTGSVAPVAWMMVVLPALVVARRRDD